MQDDIDTEEKKIIPLEKNYEAISFGWRKPVP